MNNAEKEIASFFRDNHRMPTYQEMMSLLGYKSKSAVAYLVNKLVEQGILTKARGRLKFRNPIGSAKILGVVEAGFPSPAEEELTDTMSFDEYLIENREASYILRVKGDSMIEAGICEGDMVIVERTGKYKPGDIVIAEVDGQWTIKYLRKKNNKFYLDPANKKYKPIFPKEELKIAAVVKAVVRKY